MGDAFHTASTAEARAMERVVTEAERTKAQEEKVAMSHSLTGSVTNADKRDIAVNCTSKGNANEAEQTRNSHNNGSSPSFALGQPQKEEIGLVEPIEPPGLNGVEEGEWVKQRKQRRKE